MAPLMFEQAHPLRKYALDVKSFMPKVTSTWKDVGKSLPKAIAENPATAVGGAVGVAGGTALGTSAYNSSIPDVKELPGMNTRPYIGVPQSPQSAQGK